MEVVITDGVVSCVQAHHMMAAMEKYVVFDQIIPRNLKFIGNEEILSALSKPGLEGKLLRLKGWLYTSSRVFYVSSEVKNS